jgi:hypothetical protein
MACAIAIAIGAPVFQACKAPEESRVFILDDAVKMSGDGRLLTLVDLKGYATANPAWDGHAITLEGAGRETVAFQVMIQAGARDLLGVTVHLSDLRRDGGGVLAGEPFSLYREWYVPVTVRSASPGGSAGLGDYPDALIPAATPAWGLPLNVAARKTQGIWIDCAIPGEARGGVYRGNLVVRAGDRVLARFDLRLKVHDFAIPVERHLRWRIGYSGWEAVPARLGIPEGSAEWHRLEEDLYRLVWEGHRAVPTTHYNDLRLGMHGSGDDLEIDWSGFDRRFGRFLDGSAFSDRQPVNVFSLPINPMRGWPAGVPADPEKVDEAILAAVSRLTARHWDERGWRLSDAFAYVADEPDEARHESIRRACSAIRKGDPRIRTSVTFYKDASRNPRRLLEEFAGLVTMWEVAGDHLDLPRLRAIQARGDSLGIYQGGEPYLGGEALDDDGVALTTWPWIAWRYRLDSLFLYNMTEWDYARLSGAKVAWAGGKREIWENPLNQSWATNSQGVLVYPGPYVGIRGVVGTIRLRQVRRGLQDYEYLWLAARRGAGATADEVSRRIIPRALHEAGTLGEIGARGSWERDPRGWALARRDLARAITGQGAHQPSPDGLRGP